MFKKMLLAASLAFGIVRGASGQFGEAAPGSHGPELGAAEQPFLYEVGVEVEARGGPISNTTATMAVPMDWPEQAVEIVNDDMPPEARLSYRMLGATVRQMVIQIPYLAGGAKTRAVVTFKITRRAWTAPDKTDSLRIPSRKAIAKNKELRKYLGASPYIETGNGKIKKKAKEAVKGKENAWEKVEAIYDWVRDNVAYEKGDIKGAARALENKKGDCEELTSLFIAMCRINDIPARMVWVQGHCYPEFYLEDDERHGYWFPCQAAGTRDFGGIPGDRPIWQKGDNFTTPEEPKDKKRYVSEFVTGVPTPGGGDPRVKFIRKAAAEADNENSR